MVKDMIFANAGVFSSYGASGFGNLFNDEVAKRTQFIPQGRFRINVHAVCVNIFYPWLLFTALYWLMAFEFHYNYPTLAWCAVLLSLVLSAVLAMVTSLRHRHRGLGSCPMAWYGYATGATFVATVLAALLGNMIFANFTKTYYDYQAFSTFAFVSPARWKGAMVMSAGKVYFDEAHLDQKQAMGFKHKDTYCVVPITVGNKKLATYDFWAVGVNCCGKGTFQCGPDYNNPQAKAGLRNVDEEHRPFFRLAVQQAEAAYGLTATHPIFLNWSQEPLVEENRLRDRGTKYFRIGVGAFFLFNFCAVFAAVFAFGKITPQDPYG